MLSSIAKGVLGDADLQIGDQKNALLSYDKASSFKANSYTTPKYLYKAGLLSLRLGKKSIKEYFKKSKSDFPDSKEAKFIDIQIKKTE